MNRFNLFIGANTAAFVAALTGLVFYLGCTDQHAARAPSAPSGPTNTADTGSNATASAKTTKAITALVNDFGQRLARVSLQAPIETLRDQIRSEYTELVTASLLAAWLSQPETAPGRAVSSPWPDRIEIRSVRRTGENTYEVDGEIVFVTSVELTQPGRAASREGVRLQVVVDQDGRFRIAAFELTGSHLTP